MENKYFRQLRAAPRVEVQDVGIVMMQFCWIGMFRIMAPREAWSRHAGVKSRSILQEEKILR